MADGDDTSPFGSTPQVAAVGPAPVIEAPMTNPEGARNMGLGFLAKHRADFDARTREVDNVFSKQQMNVDTMSRLLDDTTAALKKNREGRSNLGLMALGAGMMSSPGNFGTQLGAGVKAMIPAIQQERGDEQDYQLKLAQLAMRRAGIENAPLQDKLAYLRALQVGDEASMRAIESGLIKAEGQTTKAGAKTDMQQAQLEEKGHKDAIAAAAAQVKLMGEGMYSTPEQKTAAFLDAYEKAAHGFKVPEATIRAFVEGQRKILTERPKGGFDVPGSAPQDVEAAKKLGLPPLTAPSSYASTTNPADRMKLYPAEKAAYDKENKIFTADADKAMLELQGLNQAEVLLKKHRNITGPTGPFPNELPIVGGLNFSDAAGQLKSIFANNTIHSPPQGQGAISDYERKLFNAANPSMEYRTDTNLALIAQRRRILQDQITKAKFINTYFNHYKTSAGANDAWKDYASSPEGRAYDIDEKGKLIDNPNRISVQDYMRKRHGDGYAEGGQVPGYAGGGLTFLGMNPLNMDRNYWRTVAQGVLPVADEAVAGVRSVLPTAIGGTDYDTALKEERQGVKDFEDKHGAGARMAAELGGGLLTLPFTGGIGAAGTALKSLPGVTSALAKTGQLASKLPAASWLANSPRAASILSTLGKGAGIGGVQGFAAGEDGFEDRLANALGVGLFGAGAAGITQGTVKGVEGLVNHFNVKDRLANWLRRELPSDRVSAYDANPAFNAIRDKAGKIDPSHPNFADMSADELKAALQLKRTRSMDIAGQGNPGGKDVLMADALPGMTEAVSQIPGEETGRLSKQLIRRQHDPDLPLDQQAGPSQYGQVKDWFRRTFGTNDFRGTEDQLLDKMKNDAATAFRQADPHNVMSLELDDIMDRVKKLSPNAIAKAKTWAEAEAGGPRSIGLINRAGDQLNYNMRYLQDIKRLVNEELGEGAKNPRFYDKPYKDAISDLNAEMKRLNQPYRDAMQQYGENAQLVEGLRKGRQDVFGSNVNELDKGIGHQDIHAYLNDPNIPDAAKDLFRQGGARALEAKLLGSDSTKFTHNWADVLNNPNMMEKYKALLPPGKLSEWPHMVEQIRQLSNQNKLMNSALGNSKTAKRIQAIENMDDTGSNVLSNILASAVNPSAPSGYRRWWDTVSNPITRRRQVAGETANILGGAGQAGNNEAVETIRSLLSRFKDREAAFAGAKRTLPGAAAYLQPWKQWRAGGDE